jgi:trimeric autotransporter adhesin
MAQREPTCLLALFLMMSGMSYAQGTQSQQGPASGQQPTQAPQQSAAEQSETPAASPATIAYTTGQVRTQTGEPVPGATVRITNSDTHKVWLSWTDESGKFVFPQLPAGYYHVEVSQLGFTASTIDVKLPIVPSGPIPVVMNVATLAELTVPQQPPAENNSAPSKPNAPASSSAPNPPTNASTAPNAQPPNQQANQQPSTRPGQGQAGQGGFGGRNRNGGRGQLPPGITNALQQGMATTGFQQADLTGAGAGGQENENPGQSGENANATAAISSGGGAGASANSFLLQGTVGQGTSTNVPGGFPGAGFGGFGGGGPGELAPGAPGGPGQGGGSPFGGAGGGGGGGGRGGGGGGAGGRGGFGPGGGQFAGGGPPPGGPGGAPPGGIFAGRSRLMRQAANRMRFSFYDQYSNSALNAKPYSITGQDFPKVANYNERFGGNLGGPLKIPHVYNGSDKTYFFVNYQHQLVKNGVDTFSLVPTADERSGNFCNVGNGFTLYNPFSNLSGPRAVLGNGCQIPTIDSAASGLLTYIPLPNIPLETGSRGQTYNYLLQATTPQNTDTLNLHVLHTINSKLSLNGGYNLSSGREDTLGNFASIAGHESTLSQNVSLALNHNWTPSVVESTSVNWSRNRVQLLSDNSFVNNIAGQLGIEGVSTDPMNYGIPEIQFTSLGSLNDPVPSLVRNQTTRFLEGWTYVRGVHTVKFGGEVRRIQLNTDSDPNPRGRFLFTGQMTSQLNASGHSLETPLTEPYYEFADFLLGLPYNTQIRTGDPNTYFRNWEFIGYAQDDWRVNKKFTLLFGLRYSAVTPPVELYDHISNLDLNAEATAAVVVTPGQTGPFDGAYPQSLIHGDYKNFAPRIGFAWLPPIRPRTVLRGGYSIFYNDSIYATLAQSYLAYQPPFAVSDNLYTSAAQLLTLKNGFPSSASGSSICTATNTPGLNCTVPNTSGVNPFYRDAYAQIWMLSLETDLRPNWILTTTYTGTKGTDLDLLRAPNRAPLGTNPLETQTSLRIPYATSFDYDQSGADSLYNALQVRLVHRFTHGIMLQAFYTFSKSLDNASSIGGSSPIVVQQDGNYAAEWGLSSFDMRHQVRLMSLWELPFGERHRFANHGWENRLLGDWRLMNLVTWHTGSPFTAYLGGGAANNTGTGANFSERAEQVGDPNLGICGGTALDFFNTGAFAVPQAGTYGNERRGAIEGPCSFSWNLSLAKSFRFGPRERQHSVMARWEVQNVTNTPSFSGISTTVGSPLFGQVTSAGSMRTMDVVLRFNF